LPNPFAYASHGETAEHLAQRLVRDPASAGPVYQLVKMRGIAQRIFRDALFEAYGGACAFCGLTFVEALDAAHVYPWSVCSPSDRMNVRNGLLLCSNHHRMFDNKWILITDDYRIVYGDMNLTEGPYSRMDSIFGPDLHDTRIRLPARKELWPHPELIRKRYEGR
jgi:putative restriction endonuclease